MNTKVICKLKISSLDEGSLLEQFFLAQYKKRNFILLSENNVFHYLVDQFNKVIDYFELLYRDNTDNIYYSSRFFFYLVLIRLQKLVFSITLNDEIKTIQSESDNEKNISKDDNLVSDLKNTFKIFNGFNMLELDVLQLIYKTANNIFAEINHKNNEYFQSIQEFNIVSALYNLNILNFVYPYTTELLELNLDTCKKIEEEYNKGRYEKYFEILCAICFSNIPFFERKVIKVEKVFKKISTGLKHLQAFKRILSCKASSSDIRLIEGDIPKKRSSCYDKVATSRLIGLWLWDQHSFCEESEYPSIRNKAIEFYARSNYAQRQKTVLEAKERSADYKEALRNYIRYVDYFEKRTNECIQQCKVLPFKK